MRTNNRWTVSRDTLFLGTLGMGLIAWLVRRQLSGKKGDSHLERKTHSSSANPSEHGHLTQPAKRERNFVKVMQEKGRRVIFFYGSQTGTAEDYAARLAKECTKRYGVSAMTADIELYDLSYLDTVPEDCLVFFVMATYGEGEPTDNAVDFWDLIMEEAVEFSTGKEEAPLKNLHYLVFGLGNKTYEHYNSVSRTVDRRLTELGATRISERGEGDDDGSLEDDFLAWQEKMWPAFCDALGVEEGETSMGPRQLVYAVEELTSYDMDLVYLGEISEQLQNGAKLIYDAKRPYLAPISTYELFQQTNDRHCLHVNIDISGTNLSYQTGDHVAIWPTNNDTEVHRLASILGLMDKLDTVVMVKAADSASSKPYPFPVPSTYRAIFRHYLDICACPSRQTLVSLVEFGTDDQCKSFLRKLATDKDEYRKMVGDPVRNLGEVLELVAATADIDRKDRSGFFASIPFDVIVENMSRLQPRYYSISSSSKESPHVISATAVTLEYTPDSTAGRVVYGVNTNYLWRVHCTANGVDDGRVYPVYDLDGPRQTLWDGKVAKLPIHVRRSQFKLPRNPTYPVIMIGPGTGVAPFRGFVRERALQKREGKEVGPTLLFYGCRHSQEDFLYADEWPGLFNTLGENSHLITAFSRDSSEKVYVQHRLQEHGEEVWALLQQNAYIYVCGDAKNMARDVNQTFVHLAQQYGEQMEQQAHEFVKNLRTIGRYQEDVWS
ncbi:NADPH-dependent cytochrome P450 oxidoreductase [Radiomyces spectabilis]|uniref:NADPH-dependent cytochrome P450 oxidoreductase n=1 Tax=Radiomyces spectabilis TaxID=64574 RepID=UPI00222121C2|nr:NADPH-dependent cytochrome P450 oxidoreductase [Radiomyces spectabilis]KAI8365913.1 NADPH-dependent cytochrome P450 oxidoreductase [Radiomyces spectabilis]